MNITQHKSTTRTIRQCDPDFILIDGLVTVPRAMLHITPDCPADVSSKIMWAVNKGYLKTVAHVYDHELMWDKLKHD